MLIIKHVEGKMWKECEAIPAGSRFFLVIQSYDTDIFTGADEDGTLYNFQWVGVEEGKYVFERWLLPNTCREMRDAYFQRQYEFCSQA